MTKVRFNNRDYLVNPGESVLDALLRQGAKLDYSCRAGGCHGCLMQVVKGVPSQHSQTGLDDAARAQGYFLPCICIPEDDMEIAKPGQVLSKIQTNVVEHQMLNPEVLRLRLRRPEGYEYYPGQFLNLYNPEGIGRAYSIASLREEPFLELHVRHVPNGKVSGWANTRLKSGDPVTISGPSGECFYVPGHPDQPMLMIGTGTGLAPLYGILRDALAQGHRGEIHIYHGSSVIEGLYMIEEMRALEERVPNLFYYPCVGQESVPKGIFAGRENQKALADHGNLAGWRVYLCGHEEMVTVTKKSSFLAGASLDDIYSDPFVPAAA